MDRHERHDATATLFATPWNLIRVVLDTRGTGCNWQLSSRAQRSVPLWGFSGSIKDSSRQEYWPKRGDLHGLVVSHVVAISECAR